MLIAWIETVKDMLIEHHFAVEEISTQRKYICIFYQYYFDISLGLSWLVINSTIPLIAITLHTMEVIESMAQYWWFDIAKYN